ncbi:WD40 repeat domain-containing protein [Streptomyces griseofuscus]|uniref:WD40 repeat domain-containing protein n=1 Tax=Streptomyces griseofuscus TaxID=146922 RepID=UPI0037FD538F
MKADGPVDTLVFGADGELAISDVNGWRNGNKAPTAVRLFDVKDPRHPREVGHVDTDSVELAFSPDGRTLLASVGDVADKTTGRAAWSRPDSRDVTDPAHPSRLWTHRLPTGISSLNTAFRPDGKLLALYLGDGTLTLWPVAHDRLAGKPAATTQIGQYSSPLSFTPDGSRLALISTIISEGDDYTRPEIWDVSDPRDPTRESYLAEDSPGELYSVIFSPDGHPPRRGAQLQRGRGRPVEHHPDAPRQRPVRVGRRPDQQEAVAAVPAGPAVRPPVRDRRLAYASILAGGPRSRAGRHRAGRSVEASGELQEWPGGIGAGIRGRQRFSPQLPS